jgi:hypothetical protein
MDYEQIYKDLKIEVNTLSGNYNPNQYGKKLLNNSSYCNEYSAVKTPQIQMSYTVISPERV